jgi:protease II
MPRRFIRDCIGEITARWTPIAVRTRLMGAALLLGVASSSCVTGASHSSYDSVAPAELLKTINYSGLSLSRHGTAILTSENSSGRARLQIIPGDRAGSKSVPDAGQAEYATSFFPDDRRILFACEVGGSELWHLFVLSERGERIDLTPSPGSVATFQGWARGGQSFFVTTNERDPQTFDLYEYDAVSYARRLMFRGDGYELGRPEWVALTADRGMIAVERVLGTARSEVDLIDLASRAVVGHLWAEESIHVPLFFDASGRNLYFLSDAHADRTSLQRYDIVQKRREGVLSVAGADIQSAILAPDEVRVAVVTSEEGVSKVLLLDLANGATTAIQNLPLGTVRSVRFSGDSQRLAFIVEQPTSPGDIYVYDIASGKLERSAQGASPGIDQSSLPQVTHFSFKSFDGVEIPGILYSPRRPLPQRPAVIWIHGGPNGQSGFDYNPVALLLSTNGYIVYAINHRGSGGYGKHFKHLDDHRQAEENLRDVLAASGALASRGLASGNRVGIAGGSFGGFLTLAGITRYPRAFTAAVDLFGIADWERTLNSMPRSWSARRSALTEKIGDPETEAAYLRSISPLYAAARIRCPLMVVQGTEDRRVLKRESDDIVEAARRAGVPVEYLILDGEGHGWPQSKANELKMLTGVKGFLDRYLAAARAPTATGALP